jgi:2,4-diaminopentanoate dehydrogenase
MTNPSESEPRVVIYGTGQYGGFVTRLALEKGWQVVAAFNRAGDKVGQDLGRAAGLERDLGVIIQDCDTADYGDLDADIGVVTQTNLLEVNLPAYERLMNAGLNVICHGTESYYPWGNDPELAARIDALAKGNGVSFTGSGIWDMSRIWAGILVAGPCTRINSLFHSSITDVTAQTTNMAQAEQVGVGFTVDEFDAAGLRQSPIAKSYKTIPEQVLVKLGYTVTDSRAFVEPVLFDTDLSSDFLGGTIPAGDVVGTRIVGEIETEEATTARAEIDLRMFKEGEVEHMFWSVDGLPRTSVRTERRDSAHATAGCLFNRILDVIAAEPGIALISDMGPLTPTASSLRP